MEIISVFFNQYNRLRSGWRFAIFLLAFIFFGTLFHILATAALSALQVDFTPGTVNFIIINSSASLVLALVLGWLCGKYLEDLPFRALGAALQKKWLRDLIWGLILGAFALLLAVLIGRIFGGLSFEFNQAHSTNEILKTLGVSFLIFAIAAASEEALFRGYILQTFSRANLAWLAIALTSLFFASAHLANPSASYISSANTALAGIWFSVAYLKTRTLWFVFGLHLMWNWMQGAFFGIEVSGIIGIATAPVLREIDSGPAWLTGAEYGIEGGIACTIALVASTALIYFLPFLKADEDLLALTSTEISSKISREQTQKDTKDA